MLYDDLIEFLVEDARGDRVRLRLAPPDRGRGAPPRRGEWRRRSTRAQRPAQPVRIVAHSMGGAARAHDAARAPETVWKRMMARPGARLLMLGTPNGGSWAPMQVLSGDDTFGNALVDVRRAVPGRAARAADGRASPASSSCRPALLDRQARARPQRRPGRSSPTTTWRACATQSCWHTRRVQLDDLPSGACRRRRCSTAPSRCASVSTRRATADAAARSRTRCCSSSGKRRFTPDGYDIGDEGLVYLDAAGSGDGRVTLPSALPARRAHVAARLRARRAWPTMKDGVRRRTSNCSTAARHDRLTPLADERRGTRGAGSAAPSPHVRSRPSRTRAIGAAAEAERDVSCRRATARQPSDARRARGAALHVTVINGDSQVRPPAAAARPLPLAAR